MKVLLSLAFLFSTVAASASINGGVYHCHGTQYSTGDTYEVKTTPVKIEVFENGENILTVNQDKNCMVISEKTEISSMDNKSVLVHMSAFETGCEESHMLRNAVQLIMNNSSTERIANLSINRDYQTVLDVFVYCK